MNVVKYCSWVVGSVEWSVSTREQRFSSAEMTAGELGAMPS